MSDWFWKRAIEAAEKGLVPDAVLRAGTRARLWGVAARWEARRWRFLFPTRGTLP